MLLLNSTIQLKEVQKFVHAVNLIFCCSLSYCWCCLYVTKGSSLWLNRKWSTEADWCSILPHPNFDHFMLEYFFKQFQQFLLSSYEDQSLKDLRDPLWKFLEMLSSVSS
jgi:hypothetical protein